MFAGKSIGQKTICAVTFRCALFFTYGMSSKPAGGGTRGGGGGGGGGRAGTMESLVTALEAAPPCCSVRWVELSSIRSYWPARSEWREHSSASSPHRYPSTLGTTDILYIKLYLMQMYQSICYHSFFYRSAVRFIGYNKLFCAPLLSANICIRQYQLKCVIGGGASCRFRRGSFEYISSSLPPSND
jgi:hypothetical protein